MARSADSDSGVGIGGPDRRTIHRRPAAASPSACQSRVTVTAAGGVTPGDGDHHDPTGRIKSESPADSDLESESGRGLPQAQAD